MSKRNGRLRGFGIPRVSKKGSREGDRFRSPENQWRDIEQVCAGRIELVARFDDVNVSGRTMDRKGLQRGIDLLRAGAVDVLVFAKLDRFARNVKGALEVLDEVAALGGSLVFADFDIDTRTPQGREMFTLMVARAERDVEEKRIELKRNADNAIQRGVPVAPLLPGYVTVEDADTRERFIAPDDPADGGVSDLIRPMFERRAAGATWTSIREWWHEETGAWLKLDRFRRMVESRLYVGELVFGGVTSPVAHDALVDEALWDAAQTAVAPRPPRSRTRPTLLAGVLHCSGCGRPMTAGTGGRGQSLYRCQSKFRPGWTCPAPVAVTASRADEWVEERLLTWARERPNRKRVERTGSKAADFAAADAGIAKAEAATAKFLRVLASADLDEERAADELAQLREAEEDALAFRRQLEAANKAAGLRWRVEDEWDALKAAGDVEAQRQLLRAAIERVTIHPALVRGSRLAPLSDRAEPPVFIGDEGERSRPKATAR